jgi:hypothetical protein
MSAENAPLFSAVIDPTLPIITQRLMWEERERAYRRTIRQLEVRNEHTQHELNRSVEALARPRTPPRAPSPIPAPPPVFIVAPKPRTVDAAIMTVPPRQPEQVRRAADELIAQQASRITELEAEVIRLNIGLNGARADQMTAMAAARSRFTRGVESHHDDLVGDTPQRRASMTALQQLSVAPDAHLTPKRATVQSAAVSSYSAAKGLTSAVESMRNRDQPDNIVWPTFAAPAPGIR